MNVYEYCGDEFKGLLNLNYEAVFSKILTITILVIRFRQNEAYPKYEIRILFIPNHQLSKTEAADSKQQMM